MIISFVIGLLLNKERHSDLRSRETAIKSIYFKVMYLFVCKIAPACLMLQTWFGQVHYTKSGRCQVPFSEWHKLFSVGCVTWTWTRNVYESDLLSLSTSISLSCSGLSVWCVRIFSFLKCQADFLRLTLLCAELNN